MQKPKKPTREPVRFNIDDPHIGTPWEDAIFVEGGSLPNPQPPVPQVINDEISQRHAQMMGTAGTPETGQPMIAGDRNILQQIKDGFLKGYEFQQQPKGDSRYHASGRYSRSIVGDALTGTHLPDEAYQVPIAERLAIPVGRIAGDMAGFGSQSKFWNIHPLDVTSTESYNILNKMGIDPKIARAGAYTTAIALGAGSNNFNPLNVMEGGRQQGFEAISADENDPRQSTNAALDMVFHRGMLGRTGKLLPWEQFSQERPNVSYEQYEAYKEYLRDPGLMGLVKGTWEGVDGPEARIMGYRVTPLGAIAAGATLGGIAMLAGRRKRA